MSQPIKADLGLIFGKESSNLTSDNLAFEPDKA